MTTWTVDVDTTPDSGYVEEIVGDFELPCELNFPPSPKCSRPAHWVMWTSDHGHGTYVRLACDPCKELRLTSEEGVVCKVCDLVTVPARHAYSRVEPLHRTP